MIAENTMQAFQVAAGFSYSKLDVLIRSTILAIFFIWSSWCVYGQFKEFQSNAREIHELPMNILRILMLCAFVVILVFVH